MSDRYQIAALAAAAPAFLEALSPVALLAENASVALERAIARVAATQDAIDVIVAIVAGIRDIGATGAGSFSDWLNAAAAIGAIPAGTASPALTRAQDMARTASLLVSAACLQEAAVSVVVSPPASREEIEAARARLVAESEPALDGLAAAGAVEAHSAVATTIERALQGLDALALTIAPLAQIRASASLPATVLAWRLYGDVERASELVGRAGTLTPLFMPVDLTAPAPTAI